MPTPNQGALFDGVAVVAGNKILAEATTVSLRRDESRWGGGLGLAIDEVNVTEAGDLEMWLPNGRSARFAIVDTLGQTSVEIRGFGIPAF